MRTCVDRTEHFFRNPLFFSTVEDEAETKLTFINRSHLKCQIRILICRHETFMFCQIKSIISKSSSLYMSDLTLRVYAEEVGDGMKL